MDTAITLHKASDLKNRLAQRVKAYAAQLDASMVIDLFQDPVDARFSMRAKVRAAAERSDALDALRYALRERVAQQNVAVGVSTRLGQIKALTERKERLEKLNAGGVAAAAEALGEELLSRRKRFEGIAPHTSYGEGSRYDLMTLALFPAEEKDAFEGEIRTIERAIAQAKDELSMLNARATIDLQKSERDLLRQEGLLP
ncbi:MAG: hypothetical protein HXY22_12400 [Alphaproteobacteria bacterium]|nr:hypothetical protein [Alphaproteobacteria bacterium]